MLQLLDAILIEDCTKAINQSLLTFTYRTETQNSSRSTCNVVCHSQRSVCAPLPSAGLADFRGFKSNDRIASGVIYVSEETSGRVCASAMRWNPQFATSNAGNQELTFIPLDHAETRFTELR